MATCLENIVSIKNTCDAVASNSGLYLDDIDVTLREIEKYVTADYPNAAQLALDKIKFASKVVAAEINTYFQGQYRANSVIDSQRIGFHYNNKETVAASAVYKGMEIEICQSNSFLQLHLSTLELFVNYSGAVSVLVYDLIQGKLLDTIAVTAVAGEVVTVNINKTYNSNRKQMDIAIMYDATLVAQYKTDATSGGCSSCGKGSLRSINGYVRARGISAALADPKINSSMVGESFTGGLSVVYSINCDKESWLCAIQNVIAQPVLYRAATDLMRFALDYSDQFNTRTRIDDDKLKRRHDYYLAKYEETMRNVLTKIKLPSDSLCFECNDRIKSVVAIP